MQTRSVLLAMLISIPVVVAPAAAQVAHIMYRATFGYDGTPPMQSTEEPFLSGRGRYIAFSSNASNLVPGDTNNRGDCFVLDQATHLIQRVNITWDGRQSNDHGLQVRTSEDGRYAVFYTWASNMIPDDKNGWPDVFIRDLFTGDVKRVSVASDGSEGDNGAASFDITPDARFISFASHASNMVDDDTNDRIDVFLHDRQTGVTERVSVSSSGDEGNGQSSQNAINADGRYIAFRSTSDNLIENDWNVRGDVFVRDRLLGTTEVVSVSSSGVLGNGSSGYNGVDITPDGRYIAFGSEASNLVPNDTNGQIDVFVHDRWLGTTERVSVGTDGSQDDGDMPAISDDGRFVAFFSGGQWDPHDNNGEGDIYVRDRLTRTTRLVSRSTGGWVGDKVSAWPVISGDGRFIAFESDATNLVPNDNNNRRDVFVHIWRTVPGR